jgi:hypothetical protein
VLDTALFSSPPREFRPVPMWFWNGDIEEEEIRRQVRAFAEGGLGGFQIAARTGLSTPYLSQRWFDLVELAAREAAPYGLQVWLADEYPYPSGAAGGELTLRHPEYRAWHMRSRSSSVRAGARLEVTAPGAVLLHAGAVPVVNGVADWTQARDLSGFLGTSQPEMIFAEPAFGLSKKRSFSYGPRPKLDWTAPNVPGVAEWQVWLVAAAEIAPYKFFGHYVDLCNADAVRAFLALTYQRYAHRLSPAAWLQVTGFFLDESHPPSWSWSLPAAFLRRNGYDLVARLPALWTDVGPRTAAIRHDYWQTLTELFMESFHRPIAEWCRQHDVQLSLEVDSTRNSVQRHAHIAGNDPGHEKVGGSLDALHAETRPRFRAHPRFPASLAAQVGLNRVLVESYHSIGWSLTFQDMKALADRLAAQGANLFVFHAFFYSLGGLRKWDAPPSQFLQNPYWPQFPRLTDYLGRLCYALSRGWRATSVALLDPITSLWTHGSGAGGSIGAGPDAVAKRVAGDWQYLQRELEVAQRPFDSLDPLLMSEGKVADGTLQLGDAGYQVIVLPPMASLEAAAWAKLEEFAAGGGTVIACGLLPYEQLEDQSTVHAQCAARFGLDAAAIRVAYETEPAARDESPQARAGLHRQGRFLFIPSQGTLQEAQAAGDLLTALNAVTPPPVIIQSDAGAAAQRSFLIAQRQDSVETLTFLANAGNEEQDCTVALRLPTPAEAPHGVVVERLDLETGTRAGAWVSHGAGEQAGQPQLTLRLHFPRYGSHLLLLRPASATTAQEAPRDAQPCRDLPINLDGAWRCTLANDNALRLDQFRFGVVIEQEPSRGGPPEDSAAWPLIEAKPFVNVLRDLEQVAQPWPLPVRVQVGFGSPAVLKLGLPATAWYVATFDVATLPERAVLCLEAPALQGEWALWLNGQPLPATAFRQRFRWDVTNQEVDVRPLLQPGENTVAVRVAVREPTDGLVDALYLLGDFGVRAVAGRAPMLTAAPTEVRWEHLAADGLPYYAGTLHLSKAINLTPPAGEAMALRLPDDVLMYAGLAELELNGQRLGLRPWAPYRWPVAAANVHTGQNDLTVTITTPLAGLLEGKRYDPGRRDTVRVEHEA